MVQVTYGPLYSRYVSSLKNIVEQDATEYLRRFMDNLYIVAKLWVGKGPILRLMSV